eukprot:759473-Hanusia_phi.AAC.5
MSPGSGGNLNPTGSRNSRRRRRSPCQPGGRAIQGCGPPTSPSRKIFHTAILFPLNCSQPGDLYGPSESKLLPLITETRRLYRRRPASPPGGTQRGRPGGVTRRPVTVTTTVYESGSGWLAAPVTVRAAPAGRNPSRLSSFTTLDSVPVTGRAAGRRPGGTWRLTQSDSVSEPGAAAGRGHRPTVRRPIGPADPSSAGPALSGSDIPESHTVSDSLTGPGISR